MNESISSLNRMPHGLSAVSAEELSGVEGGLRDLYESVLDGAPCKPSTAALPVGAKNLPGFIAGEFKLTPPVRRATAERPAVTATGAALFSLWHYFTR